MARILSTFAADPDTALTVADVAMPAYRVELRRVTKSHRVAVLRAMRRVCELELRFGLMNGQGSQGQLIIYDRTRVLSYGLARQKTDYYRCYQWQRLPSGPSSRRATEEQMRASLASGGKSYGLVAPGGAWFKHCLVPQAEIAGDHEMAARLRDEHRREFEAKLAVFKETCPAAFGPKPKRDPDPVKPTQPDPMWDDEPAWSALWDAAQGKRQKRDVLARRVRAAGGKVKRWWIFVPRDLPFEGSQRWLGWWPEETGFSGRIFYDDTLKTVSSAYHGYTEETPKPAPQSARAAA